eukprot:gnl/Spiro4/16620_TR8952_c0_g1_i1.p1 gnl/Spiro4/16620_TR8952_c0_g1~~gnl/Spiro4/16620_TR8952_c0_g1_i1.p1  ORF type:complete len:458 (-),score=99.86 gnl/Spiro4/16620_TR8952_c0_g1_i1:60-1403(-)
MSLCATGGLCFVVLLLLLAATSTSSQQLPHFSAGGVGGEFEPASEPSSAQILSHADVYVPLGANEYTKDQLATLTANFVADVLRNDTQAQLTALQEYQDSLLSTVPPGMLLCGIMSNNNICVGGGKKIFAADAPLLDLAGHWTMDDNKGLDSSGQSNHMMFSPLGFGPGVAGIGTSALINGEYGLVIPHIPRYFTSDYTISLWIFLMENAKTSEWRPLLHKGNGDGERAPALYLEPMSSQIRMSVQTTIGGPFITVTSLSRIPLRRWTHVAAAASGNVFQVAINGIPDTVRVTAESIIPNTAPLYIGHLPWVRNNTLQASSQSSAILAFVDEIKYYARFLGREELQAEASFGLGGVESSLVTLGCLTCTYAEAQNSCGAGSRLCSDIELYGGALQVARIMGWAKSNAGTPIIWSRDEEAVWRNKNPNYERHLMTYTGLGLCCAADHD